MKNRSYNRHFELERIRDKPFYNVPISVSFNRLIVQNKDTYTEHVKLSAFFYV